MAASGSSARMKAFWFFRGLMTPTHKITGGAAGLIFGRRSKKLASTAFDSSHVFLASPATAARV